MKRLKNKINEKRNTKQNKQTKKKRQKTKKKQTIIKKKTPKKQTNKSNSLDIGFNSDMYSEWESAQIKKFLKYSIVNSTVGNVSSYWLSK